MSLPSSPFGFGIILKNLHIETTDTDWRPVVITEIVETVNKVVLRNYQRISGQS